MHVLPCLAKVPPIIRPECDSDSAETSYKIFKRNNRNRNKHFCIMYTYDFKVKRSKGLYVAVNS